MFDFVKSLTYKPKWWIDGMGDIALPYPRCKSFKVGTAVEPGYIEEVVYNLLV